MCTQALFVKSVPVQPEYERLCGHVSRPRHNRMHYMTRKSHWMQKHKFDITCPGALFMEVASNPHERENSASTFRAIDAPECTMSPEDPTGYKNISLV
jgi:hypothetical protein